MNGPLSYLRIWSQTMQSYLFSLKVPYPNELTTNLSQNENAPNPNLLQMFKWWLLFRINLPNVKNQNKVMCHKNIMLLLTFWENICCVVDIW